VTRPSSRGNNNQTILKLRPESRVTAITMKLRLEGNSIRLRVRKSDLIKLQNEGTVTEALVFPNSLNFNYALRTSSTAETIDAQLSAEGITVLIPLSIATNWLNSDAVGLEHTLNGGLFILIEKDFPCTDRPWEDTSDTFFELVNEKEALC
jgi:hypothetical protein